MPTDRTYRLTEVLRHDGAILNLATATRQLTRGRAPFQAAEGGGSKVITYPTLAQWKAAAITCDGLGTFTLGANQRPMPRELPSLCSCLTKETNQKGWELAALNKLNSGEDPGFIEKHGAIARFGQAVDKCAADKYFLSSINSTDDIDNKSEKINTGSQRVLGLLSGGPLGLVIAPWAYDLFGGNVVAWIIAGVIIGGLLWNLTIGFIAVSVGNILTAFDSKKIKK